MESESSLYGSKEPETCLSERGIKTFREFTTGLFFFFCLEFVDITMSGSINRREFENKNLNARGWRWRKIKREKLFCTRFASLARSEKNNSFKKKSTAVDGQNFMVAHSMKFLPLWTDKFTIDAWRAN